MLFSLLQSFAALTPVKQIEWPKSASIDDTQAFLIEQVISSQHFQTYPPSANYQRSFWKWVIANLEERGAEVREEIYSHYLALLDYVPTGAISLTQPPSPSYITYRWRDRSQAYAQDEAEVRFKEFRTCTLFESRTVIESGTTGLRTWTASFILAEYLTSNRDVWGSSRILEVGSGAGFLGIVLAQMQMEALNQSTCPGTDDKTRPSLFLTDLNERVLLRCESNIKLPCNNVLSHPELHFRTLDWSDALDETRKSNVFELLSEARADLILGADVIYDVSIIPALVEVLCLALVVMDSAHPIEKRAIIAATLRNEITLDAFVESVKEAGLRIEEVEEKAENK